MEQHETGEKLTAQAICTECGAVTEVDPQQDAAICSHCGRPFVVEKGIRLYQKQNPPELSEEAIRLRKIADELHMDNSQREKQVLQLFWKIFAGLLIAAAILWMIVVFTGGKLF